MSQIDKNSVKILVVDDEDYMREIVRQALENASYHVDEAADGNAAILMLRQSAYDVYHHGS